MQQPSVGRIVLCGVDDVMNNGSPVAPAVITRVWNEHPDGGWVVNVRVLLDAEAVPLWWTSVRLFDTEADKDTAGSPGAYWPPRV